MPGPAPTSPAFAGALTAARRRAGLSQSRLAARAGVNHTFVCRLENNTRGPSQASVISLASALRLRRESDECADLVRAAGYWPETPHQAARIALAEMLAGSVPTAETRLVLELAHRLVVGDPPTPEDRPCHA